MLRRRKLAKQHGDLNQIAQQRNQALFAAIDNASSDEEEDAKADLGHIQGYG